jgi:hypothetical protein
MLQKITKIGIGVLVLMLSGCYSIKNFNKLKCVSLQDDKTEFYMRKLYMVNTEFEGQKLVSKDSLKNHTDSILSEVQYLLIKKDMVIYLTTMPSKYVYDKTDTYLIGGKYPNAYYLNAMYMGKVIRGHGSAAHFIFENAKANQDWEVDMTDRNCTLVSLDERKYRPRREGEKQRRISNTVVMKPRNSFLHPVEFEKVPDIKFRYRKPLGHSDYKGSTTNLKEKVANVNKANSDTYAQCICLHVKEGKETVLDFGVVVFDLAGDNKFFTPEHVPFFRDFESERIMAIEQNVNQTNNKR